MIYGSYLLHFTAQSKVYFKSWEFSYLEITITLQMEITSPHKDIAKSGLDKCKKADGVQAAEKPTNRAYFYVGKKCNIDQF